MAKKSKKSKPKALKSRAKKKSVSIQTSAKVLKDLVTLSATMRSRSQSATGTIGQAVKDAVDSKHLHAGAFRIVNRLYQMGTDDPLKLTMLLDAFDYYRDVLLDKIKAPDVLKEPKKRAKKEAKTGEVVTLAQAMHTAIENDKKPETMDQAA